MKTILYLIILIFSLGASADEYQDIQYVDMPSSISMEMNLLLEKEGFYSNQAFKELKSIGINQVYFSENVKGYIALKFDVKGDIVLNELKEFDHGKVMHVKMNGKFFAFYFNDIPDHHVRKVSERLQNYALTRTTRKVLDAIALIPEATASDDCALPVSPLSTEPVKAMERVSTSAFTGALMSCLNGGQAGAEASLDYTSTFKDLANSAQEFWAAPTKKIDDYYKAVGGAINGFLNFTYILGEAILNPSVGLPKLEAKLGQAGPMFRKILQTVTIFPPMVALNVACSIVSGIGVDAFTTALTGGVGSVKLALTLKRLSSTFGVMEKLKATLDKLKLTSLDQLGLSNETLQSLFKKMANGTLNLKIFSTFKNALEVDSPLLRSMATQGLKCSL